MKKYLFIIALGLLTGVFLVWEESATFKEEIAPPLTTSRAPVPVPSTLQESLLENFTPPVPPAPVSAAQQALLDVPFQPQAPFADWRQPWADACEEATLVLVHRFARGIVTLSREEMHDEILELVAFQNKQYGDYKDSDAKKTAEMGALVYGFKTEMKEVKEVDEVKEVLRQGKLIIAPMAGRLLGNPYFTPPGPLYHMIVIRGFNDATGEFITNDVGTRRGEGLRYPYMTLWNALHDFPGSKEKILIGAKMIITIPKQAI